ncbi:MAG: NADP-dependent phosphogluconate dehydrogenase [Scrofimicrobium sp.]
MEIAIVGLGKMGHGMVKRLLSRGHSVVAFDLSENARKAAQDLGANAVDSLDALVVQVSAPRVVWMMLPPGSPTEDVFADLSAKLTAGDLLVDGGNSDFRDSLRRGEAAKRAGIRFADVGVSGGQWGWKDGYGLMVGSSEETYEQLAPLLQALGGDGTQSRVGDVGAGHLVKAFHNGVQYGILRAYAEGFALLEAHPEVETIAALEAWQAGSSIRSWLLEQIIAALKSNPDLAGVSSEVPDSGMGRWTAEEAVRLAVPTPVLTTALMLRFASRSDNAADRLLSAARAQIGGHKK